MRIINSLLILVLVVFQYRYWLGEGGVRHIVELKDKVQQQKALNEELHARNSVLAADVISLQKNDEGLEEYARTQLGMIKPDETFYLVVNNLKK